MLPRARDQRVHAYPHGAKAWLALSSDPDNTVKRDWDDLHRVIWEQLGLPFGDTAFIDSFNQNLPDQRFRIQTPADANIIPDFLFDPEE